MFASIGRALVWFRSCPIRHDHLKALLLTLVLFVLIVVGVEYLIHLLPTLGKPWVNRALEILAPILAVIGLLAAGGPVAALFGSLYLDRVADAIEARSYPGDAKAVGTSLRTSMGASVRLAGLVLLVDLLLLPAEALAPGAGQFVTVLANGFLLGREYFELAALRHLARGGGRAAQAQCRTHLRGGTDHLGAQLHSAGRRGRALVRSGHDGASLQAPVTGVQ